MNRYLLTLLFSWFCAAHALAAVGSAEQGLELLRAKRYNEALPLLQEASAAAPLDRTLRQALLNAWLGSGMEEMRNQRAAAAVTAFSAASELAPADANIQLFLAHAQLRAGNLSAAEDAIENAERLAGPTLESYRLLAQVRYAAGDLREALDLLEKGLELAPQDRDLATFLEKVRKEWQVEGRMASNYGGHFTVTFDGGGEALGQETLAALEEAYVKVGGLFGYYPEKSVVTILYGKQDFSAVTGAPNWSGGLYDGKIRVPVGGLQHGGEELASVLYHEYTHVLIRDLASGKCPLWLNEGLAQWVEQEFFNVRNRQLKELLKQRPPLPFSRLQTTLTGLSDDEAALAYAQSLSLVDYLIAETGFSAIAELLAGLGRGESFATASRTLLAPWHGDFAVLVADWQQRLATPR